MMLLFATEFPIDHGQDPSVFLRIVREWLLTAHETALTPEDLATFTDHRELIVSAGDELVRMLRVSVPDDEAVAVGYARQEGSLKWATTLVFSRQAEDTWVSVRVSADASERGVLVPTSKKPVIVHTLIEELGGAMDGALAVRTTPVRLTDLDMELAVLCVTGEAGCRLPVVYVSVDQTGDHVLHVDALALALAGSAHVVVEPDRLFSMQLKHLSGSHNVYGGTIGVHWPDGNGRRPFFVGGSFRTAADLGPAIIEEIRRAMVGRQPLSRCAWATVQQAHARLAAPVMKAAEATEG
jgi:hypothetical protein